MNIFEHQILNYSSAACPIFSQYLLHCIQGFLKISVLKNSTNLKLKIGNHSTSSSPWISKIMDCCSINFFSLSFETVVEDQTGNDCIWPQIRRNYFIKCLFITIRIRKLNSYKAFQRSYFRLSRKLNLQI